MYSRDDDDATKLPSLTLGKKLTTESPTASYCLYAATTYKIVLSGNFHLH